MTGSTFLVFICTFGAGQALKIDQGTNFKHLRTSYTPPISCPKDIIPPTLPNSSSSSDMDTLGNNIFRYRCNYGYVSSNQTTGASTPQEFLARCENTGTNGAVQVVITSTCVTGYCNMAQLLRVKNANISPGSSNVSIGTVASANCAQGYSIDGSANGPRSRQYTCQQDISWSPSISEPDCLPISCGQVQPFPNAIITSGQTPTQKIFYNNTVTYKCSPGYVFKPLSGSQTTDSAFSMVCSDSGSMVPRDDQNAVSPGSCVPLTCPLPAPTFPRADLVGSPTDSIELGTQIQYVCKMGTYFTNNTDVSVPSPRAATVVPESSFRVTCIRNADGTASFDTSSVSAGCFAEKCPNPPIPPPHVRFASNTPIQSYVGDTVRYVCADGYLYRGVPVAEGAPLPTIDATCNGDKNWVLDEGSFSVCVPGQCPSLANIPLNLVDHVDTKSLGSPTDHMALGARQTVRCEDGFFSSKNSSDLVLTCNQAGQFEISGKCSRRCGPLPAAPGNAVASISDGSPYVEGESLLGNLDVKFACKPGFSLDGKPQRGLNNTVQTFRCSMIPGVSDFEPKPSTSACAPITCGYPPSRENAQWVLNSPHQDYKVGESVKYTCSDGMGVFGSSGKVIGNSYEFRCTETGWESNEATKNECRKITCLDNPTIGNGTLVGPFKEVVNVGDIIGVECNYGYDAIGIKNGGITCTNSGDYAPINYATDMCQPVRCPTLPTAILGATKISDKTSLAFGEAPIKYTCDPSWNLPPIQVKCLQDRTYQIDGQQCLEPVCGSSVGLPLTNVLPVGNATSSIGTIANAQCQQGYATVDNSVQFQVKCVGQSTWETMNPSYKDGCPLITGNSETVLIR